MPAIIIGNQMPYFFFNNHSDTFELHYLMNFLWHVDQLLVLAFGAHFQPLLWVPSRTKSAINAVFSLVTLLIRLGIRCLVDEYSEHRLGYGLSSDETRRTRRSCNERRL